VRAVSKWTAAVVIVLSTVACDRASKHLAQQRLAGGPGHSYLADTLRVQYTENRGGFLSLGADLPPRVRSAVFTVGTLALLGMVAAVLGRRSTAGATAIGLSLLWAGGASNIVDRLTRGAVVDFLNVGIGPLRTGIFNVADVAITAGIAVLLLGARPPGAETVSKPPDAS
jgi:signal peptidase II